ncbi:hypothetical protein EUX98_g7399 [Antrodiella citrinella]|uniref:F-box domain-containing protein n=1 Tax=Antrodiella citrinella TaxID=2447956 RepID=A0A4S4MNK1_9APHY|nr:hypothetical protein EUX98_g7399 [Antrodiella citrinella]
MEDCTLPSAAFSALPVDILRKVFLFVGPNVLSKIALTHVCKHWRTTALEFPLMWTHLDLDYLSGLATVAMVLQRSKGLPLSLHCSIWTALRHSVCVSEIRRTCEVDFSIDSYSQLTVRHFLENTSAPVLIRCSLEFSTYEIQAPSIFKKQHPLLRDLSLTSCRMAYTAGNYFGLRRLEIRCTVEPDLTYPEDECLVELFKWSPDLEEVVLHSCAVHPQLTKAYVGDGRRTNITHLPKLRLMDLRLRTSNIHAIASSIRPSSDLSLNIVASICPATPEDEQILSEHSPLMAAALNRAQAIVLDGRALTMAAFMDVDLRNESMRVQLDYPHPLNFYNVLLKPTITSDMLPNLRRLRFRHTSAEDVVTILRSLPSVTTLELCVDESEGFSCRDILSVLEAEIRSGTSLCQALQTLSFDDARLDSISRATLVQLRALLPNLRRLALYRCEVEVGLEATLGALSTFDVVEWSEHEISSS